MLEPWVHGHCLVLLPALEPEDTTCLGLGGGKMNKEKELDVSSHVERFLPGCTSRHQ